VWTNIYSRNSYLLLASFLNFPFISFFSITITIYLLKFTILLVGYFVLGPSDLFKLTKEVGKFVQNVQSFATEATATLETSMEDQLQLEDIRKAQRELNEAFSFRRTINVDSESEAFSVNVQSPRVGDEYEPTTTSASEEGAASGAASGVAASTTATAVAPKKKKRIRRIKRKKVVVDDDIELANDIPTDLEMPDDVDNEFEAAGKRMMESLKSLSDDDDDESDADADADAEEWAAQTRKERRERLEQSTTSIKDIQSTATTEEFDMSQQSRFQQQLSENWNDQILANNDKLEPLALVMERLALLENEKDAQDKRLQEEFKLREENEEKFYLEKRKLLEQAAAEIQASAYSSDVTSDLSNNDDDDDDDNKSTTANGSINIADLGRN
jgi:Sec-independent protein translocase protein TatA